MTWVREYTFRNRRKPRRLRVSTRHYYRYRRLCTYYVFTVTAGTAYRLYTYAPYIVYDPLDVNKCSSRKTTAVVLFSRFFATPHSMRIFIYFCFLTSMIFAYSHVVSLVECRVTRFHNKVLS